MLGQVLNWFSMAGLFKVLSFNFKKKILCLTHIMLCLYIPVCNVTRRKGSHILPLSRGNSLMRISLISLSLVVTSNRIFVAAFFLSSLSDSVRNPLECIRNVCHFLPLRLPEPPFLLLTIVAEKMKRKQRALIDNEATDHFSDFTR